MFKFDQRLKFDVKTSLNLACLTEPNYNLISTLEKKMESGCVPHGNNEPSVQTVPQTAHSTPI